MGGFPILNGDPNKYVERIKEGTFEFLRVDAMQPIIVILGKGEYDFESGRQRIAKPWVISVKNAKECTESKFNSIEWQEENQQDHFQEYLDWDDSITPQGSNDESS